MTRRFQPIALGRSNRSQMKTSGPNKQRRNRRMSADDASDVQAFEAHKRREAMGLEEKIPVAMVKRLIEGENPVLLWREHRGISGKDLASKASISAAFVSRIERQQRRASPHVMQQLANALGVEISDLRYELRRTKKRHRNTKAI
jgi:ribosome-binding protein aMBF1 (putative translation factor)